KRTCPPPLDPLIPLAVTTGQDQLPIGLLDERPEELSLDLQTGGMDVRLDRLRQMRVLGGHRQGDLQFQRGREILAHPIDRVESDGNLKSVGIAHGESPYCFPKSHRPKPSRSCGSSWHSANNCRPTIGTGSRPRHAWAKAWPRRRSTPRQSPIY